MKKSFGIIGNPIKHSLSPILHKYWFDKYNIDADYVTMEAKDNDLPKIISRIKEGSLTGINVTLLPLTLTLTLQLLTIPTTLLLTILLTLLLTILLTLLLSLLLRK